MRRLAFVILLGLSAAGAAAREYSPRVVSPHNADAYSMKTFRQFPRWRNLQGDQLAWEVYKYLVDTRTGVFHMNEVLEGDDVLSEYRSVRDPVKIINVYGYGYCGIFGPVMAGVCEDMGLGKARTVVLPDWNHVTSEAFYGGTWHYLDLDVRAVFRRPDGTLASMADARQDASLWTGRGPLFFPNDSLERTREIYAKTPVWHFHGFNQSGHTMDYVLRQGETFTRWWTSQGGRWHHAAVYHEQDWLREVIEQEPRGPKPNHRHFTIHNYANGRFVYRPNLTDRSTDFLDGAYDTNNVRPVAQGVTLVHPGEGRAIFEVRTPYVIVPLVGKMETRDDDREASVVDLDAKGASLSISVDGGLTWQEISVPSRPARVDLTQYASGRYGYLLRLTLRGKPGEAVVRSLRVTTWVQVAPAALPSLRRGTNRMEYRTGDDYGLKTRVVEVTSNASHPEELFKHLVEPPEDYDPFRRTARIRGPLIAKLAAPPGTKIAWFSATGSFRTHLHEAARNTRNSIAYAVDKPGDFQEIYCAGIAGKGDGALLCEAPSGPLRQKSPVPFSDPVPADTEHWHYNAHREVRLEGPAERLFVRYVGDPALNNFRIYAHCLDDGRRCLTPVVITHVWREKGQQKEKTVTLRSRASYEIVTEDEPTDESITIAVPSHVAE